VSAPTWKRFSEAVRSGHFSALSCSEFRVFFSLLSHARADGKAWPSIATIAAESGVSVRSVYRALAALEQRRLLIRGQRSYRILPDAPPAAPSQARRRRAKKTAAASPRVPW
jgi:DNA-binding IclR family transcriptional regulator